MTLLVQSDCIVLVCTTGLCARANKKHAVNARNARKQKRTTMYDTQELRSIVYSHFNKIWEIARF